MELDYYHQKVNVWVASRATKGLKTLDFPEMLGFDGEYPAGYPKAKLWRFFGKSCKKSTVKHSIEKPILLDIVNFSTTFCPRLWEGLLN